VTGHSRAALPLRGFGGCDDPEAAQQAWDDYSAAMDEWR
jgi:hypothetical protein